MLRSIGPDALVQLQRAASMSDVALDLALLRIGVLAPLDLQPIRDCLRRPGVTITAGANGDGHRVVAVSEGTRPLAWIHHDGEVVTSRDQRLRASA